eukprot:TRINITY_DN192_c0_g1_i2.p1 TRINITY_DN192_c0_g1~~TRINITY_DN192_c0_g1_i2.p1  ORF type:complete len:551 (-),score=89.08 TRINITY_DN192_c0_g1_i2:637-2289(-)
MERLREGVYMVLVAVIGSQYAYVGLLAIPLYQAVVKSRNEEALPPSVVGPAVVMMKLFCIIVHALAPRLGGDSLRWNQARLLAMTATAVGGVVMACHDGTGAVGVLIGLSLLGLTSSRAIGGPLFVAPSETRMQRRTLVYDLASGVGCLWTSVVIRFLEYDAVREYWFLRFLVMVAPIVVACMAWLLLPEAAYFSSTRMETEQQRLLGEQDPLHMEDMDFPEEDTVSKCQVAADPEFASSSTGEEYQVAADPEFAECSIGEEYEKCGGTPASTATMGLTLPGEAVDEAKPADCLPTPTSEVNASMGGIALALESPTSVGKSCGPGKPALRRCASASWTESPWKHDGFVLIACIWFVMWWSFNFYAYNVFPFFISQSGPSMEAIGVLYTIEGLLVNGVMMLGMRFLKTHTFEKFFICSVLLAILPMPVIVWHEHCHWFLYMIVLAMMDIACACVNLLLAPVLLRCVPWNLTSSFYSQGSAIGAILCSLSFGQYSLHEYLGWPGTVLLGHGGCLFVFVCVMIVKKDTLLRTYRNSKVSVKSLRATPRHAGLS